MIACGKLAVNRIGAAFEFQDCDATILRVDDPVFGYAVDGVLASLGFDIVSAVGFADDFDHQVGAMP